MRRGLMSCRGCCAKRDRKSTRLNSSHGYISYAVFCLKKKSLIVAGTFFWLGRRDVAVNGPPQLLKAPPGPYKIKPANAGGLDVSGESETAFETTAGWD